jgi:hypothetical protein
MPAPSRVSATSGAKLARALAAAGLMILVATIGLRSAASPTIMGLALGGLSAFTAAYVGLATGASATSGSVLPRLLMLVLLPPIGSILLLALSWDVAKGFTYAGLTTYALIQGISALAEQKAPKAGNFS